MESPVVQKIRSKNRITLMVLFGVLFVAALVFVVFWMMPGVESMEGFEEPKLTVVHVDEEPFMRMELAPGETYRPIDVMAGTTVKVECEVVSRADSRKFALTVFGCTTRSNDCQFAVDVPNEIGRMETLSIDFIDGNGSKSTDIIKVPLVVVATGERLYFQGLEDERRVPLKDVSVPARVYVFAKAIARIDEPVDAVALFFVADSVDGVPILQLAPMKEGDKEILPNEGPVVRYRTYGKDLGGYALWSTEPVAVGSDTSERKVMDLFVGIFAKADVQKVFEKTLSVRFRDDHTLSITPLVRDIESVKALTLGGRMMSPALHVVRNVPVTMIRNAAGKGTD